METNLSTIEQKIAKFLAQGKTDKQIAEQVHRAISTVKFHVSNLLRKLDAVNRTALAAKLVAEEVVTKSDLRHLAVVLAVIVGFFDNGHESRRIRPQQIRVGRASTGRLQIREGLAVDFLLDLPEEFFYQDGELAQGEAHA